MAGVVSGLIVSLPFALHLAMSQGMCLIGRIMFGLSVLLMLSKDGFILIHVRLLLSQMLKLWM